MRLNTIKPGEGSTHAKRRVGRGIGSGLSDGRPRSQRPEVAGGFHKVRFRRRPDAARSVACRSVVSSLADPRPECRSAHACPSFEKLPLTGNRSAGTEQTGIVAAGALSAKVILPAN